MVHMNLVSHAHMVAMDFLGSNPEFPFGADTAVFKVKGKMFMYVSEHQGQDIVTVKCDPEMSGELRRAFDSITPGYHMNKKHWITITEEPGITQEMLAGLIEDSYQLVVETLPKRLRPPA
ncbi:hypothetical protein CFAEC_04795 [Corynebacterium faecale]|nr:hypothetical protein CFAEC_04795 [Corynebacterium faecale]